MTNTNETLMTAATQFANDLIEARNALQSILNAGRASNDPAALLAQINKMRGIAIAALGEHATAFPKK